MPSSASRLQSLVNETATQIKLAFRNNAAEHAARRAILSAAVEAWRAAPRSEENNQRLTEWLRAAIRSSMPGSREPLPTLPEFKIHSTVPPAQSVTRQKAVLSSGPQQSYQPNADPEKTPAAPAHAEVVSESDADFWSGHPAGGELPADLSKGDPFQDDPLFRD